MMVVVALYGCIYAMLAAKYKQEQLKESLSYHQQPLTEVREPEVRCKKEEDEKEMESDFSKGAEARDDAECMVLPPEVCL